MKMYTSEDIINMIDEQIEYYKESFFSINSMSEPQKILQTIVSINSKIESLGSLKDTIVSKDM